MRNENMDEETAGKDDERGNRSCPDETFYRNSCKCDSISRPRTRNFCRGSRSSNQKSVRFNRRWEAPGACLFSQTSVRSFTSLIRRLSFHWSSLSIFFSATTAAANFANRKDDNDEAGEIHENVYIVVSFKFLWLLFCRLRPLAGTVPTLYHFTAT